MARRNLDLRTSRAGRRYADDSDPMSTVGNIADVMLVFACGLMMALVTYWNVDISSVKEVLKQDQIAEVESPEELTEQLTTSDGTSYIDMGSVYMNPATGKYYMLTENAESLEDSGASGASSSSTDTGTTSSGTDTSSTTTSTSSSADTTSPTSSASSTSTSTSETVLERSQGGE